MEILVIIGLIFVIALLYQLSQKISVLCSNLPNITGNNIKCQNEKDSGISIDDIENISSEDKLAEWVEKNKNDKTMLGKSDCYAKCNSIQTRIYCDVKHRDKNGNTKKNYQLNFRGILYATYGFRPYKEPVCDFEFRLFFEDTVKKTTFCAYASQDIQRIGAAETVYHDKKHTISIELQENISELQKYESLLLSGKRLGAEIWFGVNVNKVKMNGNMLENKCEKLITGNDLCFNLFTIWDNQKNIIENNDLI